MSSVLSRHSTFRAADEDRTGHPLNAARGILIACVISVGLWAGIVAAVVAALG